MLDGLHVVERGELGGFGARLLAAMGATVVPDPPLPTTDPAVAGWRNRFKAQPGSWPDGTPDLVVDGRPGAAGEDAEQAPTVRVTLFGESGPRAGWQGDELVVQALSGFMGLNGYEDTPVAAAGNQAEVTAGTIAAIAALLVLQRDDTDAATSWLEAMAVGHETEHMAWTTQGERLQRIPGRAANVDPDVSPWQWRGTDGRYLNTITPALTTARWGAILDWLVANDAAGDLTDERFRRGAVRLQEERHIWDVVGRFLETLPAEEAFEQGQARNLPWGVVRRPEENLEQEQHRGRPIFESGLPWRVHEGPPSDRRPRPLEQLRVLDFTWQIMGPTATRILAAVGADVVRVERTTKPDLMRLMAVGSSGLFTDLTSSPFFRDLNAGKRSIELDVVAERDKALQLVAAADVIVENFSSRVMERLGLSFDDLQAVNPAIVYLSMSGFGHEGPRRDYDTWGPSAQALSGCTWLSQVPGREPAGYGFSYLDYLGGYMGCLGLLGALWATRRDGRPRWVDVSQVEVGLVAASLAIEAPEAVTLGNPGPVVRSGDGRWVVGMEGEIDDAHAAVEAAQAAGRTAGVVQDAADRLSLDPQLAHLALYPEADGFVYERVPIRIGGRPMPVRSPGPALGAHTEEVLSEWKP